MPLVPKTECLASALYRDVIYRLMVMPIMRMIDRDRPHLAGGAFMERIERTAAEGMRKFG